MKIEQLDVNFKVTSTAGKEFLFADVTNAPFELEGFPWRGSKYAPFRRIPDSIVNPEAAADGKEDPSEFLNSGIHALSYHTPGGAVRFRSESKLLAPRAKLAYSSSDSGKMPRTCRAGFDIYFGRRSQAVHFGTAWPDEKMESLECMITPFMARFPMECGGLPPL